MENKQQRPIFLGFSSQKGGVGKSTLAEIVSSILYYEQGINLFVMDCDLSQDSFYKLREREKSIVQESEELSKSMQEYFHHLGKKAYRIYKSAPKEAVRTARSKIDGISNEKYQLVIFDFPGHAGTTELMELSLQMTISFLRLKPTFSRWFHVWHTPRPSRRLEFRCPTLG